MVVGGVRYVSLYLPNGNPIDSEKFPYKLGWMDRMITRQKNCWRRRRNLSLAVILMSAPPMTTYTTRQGSPTTPCASPKAGPNGES